MSAKAGLRAGAVVAALAATMLCSAVAFGAVSFTPTLGSPNHKHVRLGTITIQVHAPYAKSVFVAITRGQAVKKGVLKECTNATNGCADVYLKHWKGHKNWWILKVGPAGFGGWWTTTPGKYHWQAESFAKTPPCSFSTSACYFYSRVGSFTVK